MEPKRVTGDDRWMWRARMVAGGDHVVVEHEQDARDLAGDDAMDDGEIVVEPILVTADEWNEMPEFEGW
jgi:hypothetical protein